MEGQVIAGIVLFDPDIGLLCENVRCLSSQVSKVVLVDNGSRNMAQVKAAMEAFSNVILVCNDQNRGIAFAMNQIGDQALVQNAWAFLTFDQDSRIHEGMVCAMAPLLQEEGVGIVCPHIDSAGDFVPREEIHNRITTISSGNLVLTKAWQKVGGYWEYLFIDEVDHEFCYCIRKCGYRILETKSTYLSHKIGDPASKEVFGRVFSITNHSAFRRYYMVRNSLLMSALYPDETEPFPSRNKRLLEMLIAILLCEEKKISKVCAMIRGAMDALLWRIRCGRIVSRREI